MPERQESSSEQGFISQEEYKRRLEIIEEEIFRALELRDQEFDGDDGVIGVLIFGSYAKSHPLIRPTIKRKISVHSPPHPKGESDIDITLLTNRRGEEIMRAYREEMPFQERVLSLPKHLSREQEREALYRLHPLHGFQLALDLLLPRTGLKAKASVFDNINVDEEFEPMSDLIRSKNQKDGVYQARALLMIPEGEDKSNVLDFLRAYRVDVILNPSGNSSHLFNPPQTAGE